MSVKDIGVGDDSYAADIDALKRMDASQKPAVMTGLIRQAYALAAAGVRLRDPSLPDDLVEARARELVGGERP